MRTIFTDSLQSFRAVLLEEVKADSLLSLFPKHFSYLKIEREFQKEESMQ